MRRFYIELIFAGVILAMVAIFTVAYGQAKTDTAADRRQQIEECEGNGGIPVVVAGVLNSRGIACAQPLGY